MYIDLSNSKGFLYEKLYEQIIEKIKTKELKAGQSLPSIRSLSRDLKISINTVKKAYYQLEVEGYIESKPRSGFFIKDIGSLIVLDSTQMENMTNKKERKVAFDFSFSGVDLENFPFATFRKIFKESICEGDDSLIGRGHFKGQLNLRLAICEYLKKSRGIDSKAKNIIISSGTESLFNLVKDLLNDQTLYAFENPGYAFGSKFYTYNLLNPLPLEVDGEGVRIDSVSNINACCIFVTPNNQFPMGTIMSIQRRIDLLNWAAESKSRYIIEDDYAPEFKFDSGPIAALKSIDKNDDVIYMGTFSKTISPALRISYMVLPDDLLEIYEENFVSLGCPVSLYIQKATAKFISKGYFEKHINRMKNIYAEKYSYIVSLIRGMTNIEVVTKGASLTLVVRLKGFSQLEDHIEVLRDMGVKIQPVKDFTFNKRGYCDLFILGFASLNKNEIEEGLIILEETLKGLNG